MNDYDRLAGDELNPSTGVFQEGGTVYRRRTRTENNDFTISKMTVIVVVLNYE